MPQEWKNAAKKIYARLSNVRIRLNNVHGISIVQIPDAFENNL
jgi:hypothetical protein